MNRIIKCGFIFIIALIFNNNLLCVSDELKLSSRNVVVVDNLTGRVLYHKNAYDRVSIASLTKVMTSIMLVSNCSVDEKIEVPNSVKNVGGSLAGLKANEKVTAYNLLYSMLLPSGNDAAYTVGHYIGNGNIENFALMMTKKAKNIGAQNTSFANPHGLDNENHYSTAYDMALITRYALKNKYINEAVNTRVKTVNLGSFSKTFSNTNALLSTYPYADGVKTGYTANAGRCLITSATKDKKRYIAVVLGADTTNIRFSESKKVLDYCFENYEYVDISDLLNIYVNIPVKKGSVKQYEAKEKYNFIVPLKEGEFEKIYIKQNLIKQIVPPMSAGEKIGDFSVCIDDEIIYTQNIYLRQNIYSKSVRNYISDAIKNMFNEYPFI